MKKCRTALIVWGRPSRSVFTVSQFCIAFGIVEALCKCWVNVVILWLKLLFSSPLPLVLLHISLPEGNTHSKLTVILKVSIFKETKKITKGKVTADETKEKGQENSIFNAISCQKCFWKHRFAFSGSQLKWEIWLWWQCQTTSLATLVWFNPGTKYCYLEAKA